MNLIVDFDNINAEAKAKANILVVLLLRVSNNFFDYARFSKDNYFAKLLNFKIETR